MAKINIQVVGYPAGNPGDPIVHPYSVIASSSPVTNLSLTDETGVDEIFWSFLSKPVGSSATIQSATSLNASFQPDTALPGSYLIECSINNGSTVLTNGIGFTTSLLEVRIPSAKERGEFDPIIGWDGTMQDFMRKVDQQIGSGVGYWTRYNGDGVGGSGYYLSPSLSERLSVPLGEAGAPSIAFEEDLGTGIWSPGEGIIALSTEGVPRIQTTHEDSATYFESIEEDTVNQFIIRNIRLGSGLPSELQVVAEGSDGNSGGHVYVRAKGGSSGTAEMHIVAEDGLTSEINISADNGNVGSSSVLINATTEGISSIGLQSESIGSGFASTVIRSVSAAGDSSVIIGSRGVTGNLGVVQIGESDTGSVVFSCSHISDSIPWTGDSLSLVGGFAEVDAYHGIYGDASLIAALVAAGSAGSSSLTETYIGVGNASNQLSGSSAFTYNDTNSLNMGPVSAVQDNSIIVSSGGTFGSVSHSFIIASLSMEVGNQSAGHIRDSVSNSFIIGVEGDIDGSYIQSIGYDNDIDADYAFVSGSSNIVTGSFTQTVGRNVTTSFDYSRVHGRYARDHWEGARFTARDMYNSERGSCEGVSDWVLVAQTDGDETVPLRPEFSSSDSYTLAVPEGHFVSLRVDIMSTDITEDSASSGYRWSRADLVFWFSNGAGNSVGGSLGQMETVSYADAAWTVHCNSYDESSTGEFDINITTAGATGRDVSHVVYISGIVSPCRWIKSSV